MINDVLKNFTDVTVVKGYYTIRYMSKDNLESDSQIEYSAPKFCACRKRISQFDLEDFLENGPQSGEKNMKEVSAKNVLMEIGDRQANLGVRMRERKMTGSGWLEDDKEIQRNCKTFRTRTYSKNKKNNANMHVTLQSSPQLEKSQIPRLKNILKKLQSPQRPYELQPQSFKENLLHSDKRLDPRPDQLAPITYKFQPAFHTVSNRKASFQKRRKIVTYNQYKQTHPKKSTTLQPSQQQKQKIANILIIKYAARHQSRR